MSTSRRKSFSIKVIDPEKFVKNFVPPSVFSYSFDYPKVKAQTLSEFLQSFVDAINTLSTKYRISQLPSQANELAVSISEDSLGAGTWDERFGFKIQSVGIENIELTEQSRELIKQYSANKMNTKAYEDISQQSSNIAAQQKIAQGIQDNGLGDGGGMLFGMNMAGAMNPVNAAPVEGAPATPAVSATPAVTAISFDEQIEAVKKLKDLLDSGILSQEEFDMKKKEIMGL